MDFSLIFILILDYGIWPNFHPNTIDYGFNLHNFDPNTIDYGFRANFHPTSID